MAIQLYSRFDLGDICVRYVTDETQHAGLQLIPASMTDLVIEDPDCAIEPLVQLKQLGDPYAGSFGSGITMRDSATVDRMCLVGQTCDQTDDAICITTQLSCDTLSVRHYLSWDRKTRAFKVWSDVTNTGLETKLLELLSSVSLGMLTPFQPGLNEKNLKIYRMRSRWANEAVLESRWAEEMLLVPSSLMEEIYTVRYGHIGNKPTNGFIPFGAVEDVRHGVMWGMQLSCASSWQIEFSRRDNGLSISGGLADADFGHWMKQIEPGECFTSPEAWITVCKGNIDDLCGRLVDGQSAEWTPPPAAEEQLPVVFNEWCTSWGCPDAVQMEKLTRRLAGWPVRYLVMDAGWYKGSAHEWYEMTGDWIPSAEKYPDGLKAVCDHIRQAGFVPGIWFEIETCGVLSQAWMHDDLLLKRHGLPLIAKGRKFWDFRDPRVWDYMCERVIGLIREAGIGYIKVDSNESIGAGCDGAESLGEGLRQQIQAVQAFFVEMRRQVPDLVIENCSSGGHRLVSSFMNVSSMASFSDAFETEDIPVIAANLHRVIQPRQSQVWCIVRKAHTEKELYYKLSAGFLGRIGMSGDIYDLNDEQCKIVLEALEKYRWSTDVIRDGFSRRYGEQVFNYRYPKGWQAVVREGKNGHEKMVVVHRFHEGPSCITIPVGPDWLIAWSLKRPSVNACMKGKNLLLELPENLEGAVIMLTKE